jgi:hypothetical protein
MPVLPTIFLYKLLLPVEVGWDATNSQIIPTQVGQGGVVTPVDIISHMSAAWVAQKTGNVTVKVVLRALIGGDGDVRGQLMLLAGGAGAAYDAATASSGYSVVAVTTNIYDSGIVTMGWELSLAVAQNDIVTILFTRDGTAGGDTAGNVMVVGFEVSE